MKYLPAIILLGYALPGIVGLILLSGGIAGWRMFSGELEQRQSRLATHRQDLLQIQKLEAHAAGESQWLEFVRSIMDGDQYTDIGDHVRRTEEESGGAVRRTAYRRESGDRTTLAPLVRQRGEILEMGFRGSYLAMQGMFARLERSRPNLILERLEVELAPGGGKPGELAFEARYLAVVGGGSE